MLKGNGRAYYFDFDPDFKFTQKNFREKYHANPEFAEKFNAMMEDLYSDFIYQPERFDVQETEDNQEDATE